MPISVKDIKQLREETGAGVLECRQALEESGGDMDQAREILKAQGLEKAASKSAREIKEGLIVSYIHAGGRIGVLVSLGCETDFVARMEEFSQLANAIAQQVAAMNPKTPEELLAQPYIRDASKTVGELITELVAKTKENIELIDFVRLKV